MDTIIIVLLITSVCSMIISIICFYFTFKTKRRYEKLALKLGNGEDITNIIKKYIEQVQEVKIRDEQIINCFNRIIEELKQNVQKVGLY